LELSGGLRGRGITLDLQYNRIEADTVVDDFTGGVYVDGEAKFDVFAIEGAYWLGRIPIELGGALSSLDSDGYQEAWETATAVVNVHGLEKFSAKLQLTHSWVFNRFGIPSEDFQETRIQLQYVW
jgi:hypothetical protein